MKARVAQRWVRTRLRLTACFSNNVISVEMAFRCPLTMVLCTMRSSSCRMSCSLRTLIKFAEEFVPDSAADSQSRSS